MQKRTENTVSGGIATREYSPILTGIKFTNNVSKQLQMLSNHWLKDHVQTPENCQISYTKFHILFKNIHQNIATKFLSTFVLSLALENFICAKPARKYLNLLQSYSIGSSIANWDTNNPIVMQISLTARSTLSDH